MAFLIGIWRSGFDLNLSFVICCILFKSLLISAFFSDHMSSNSLRPLSWLCANTWSEDTLDHTDRKELLTSVTATSSSLLASMHRLTSLIPSSIWTKICHSLRRCIYIKTKSTFARSIWVVWISFLSVSWAVAILSVVKENINLLQYAAQKYASEKFSWS